MEDHCQFKTKYSSFNQTCEETAAREIDRFQMKPWWLLPQLQGLTIQLIAAIQLQDFKTRNLWTVLKWKPCWRFIRSFKSSHRVVCCQRWFIMKQNENRAEWHKTWTIWEMKLSQMRQINILHQISQHFIAKPFEFVNWIGLFHVLHHQSNPNPNSFQFQRYRYHSNLASVILKRGKQEMKPLDFQLKLEMEMPIEIKLVQTNNHGHNNNNNHRYKK